MIRQHFYKSNLSFRDKISSLDFSLIFLILLLGLISFFAMYSSEQGKFGYYTKSHIYRFSIFLGFYHLVAQTKVVYYYRHMNWKFPKTLFHRFYQIQVSDC